MRLFHEKIALYYRKLIFEANIQEQLRFAYMSIGQGSNHSLEDDSRGVEHETKDIWGKHRKKYPMVYEMFDGDHSFDKICLRNELSQNQLEDIVERDPDVYVTWK
jgi:hypothetical protein